MRKIEADLVQLEEFKMNIVVIALIIALGALVVGLLIREFERERERQQLAKKNMSFIESINLTGLPIITFHNNGIPVNMVLDTGSNVCLINQCLLPQLEHSVGEKHSGVIGLSGEADTGDIVTLPFTYKEWKFDFECWATDISEMTASLKKEYGVTIHGLLGTGFFQKYKYVLDFSSMVAYPKAVL